MRKKKRPVAHPELLAKITQFIKETGITPTKFGVLTINDPDLIPEIKGGRELRRATLARVEGFMEKSGKAA